MTDRKPAGMDFTSWIDQQISEAAKRGAFDNLPGTGKPLPKTTEDAGQAWLREYLRREGVQPEELLPTPLRLRKERERLTATVHELRSEQDVRDAVAELNQQITGWRRFPSGPPVYVPLADEEALLSSWREAHRGSPPGSAGSPASSASHPDSADRAPDGDRPASAAPRRMGWRTGWRLRWRRRLPGIGIQRVAERPRTLADP